MYFQDTNKLSHRKRYLRKVTFYFFLCCLIPVLFIFLIEISLRAVDYGYPSGFFIKQKIGAEEFYVNNYKFSWRFFPRSIARLPASVVVPVKKEENVFRIFVFGESAAMGDPDPAFSFSRILQVRFEKKYPDKKVEIYNTAVTAINSHVLVPIVEDCLELEPDLFVIYAGNNEVIGPFGLSTALSPFFSSPILIKAKIWIGQLRIGQWLASFKSGEEPGHQEWRGMEMFMKNQVRHDDPNLEIIYRNFQENLSEICDKSNRAGVEVILSTVITNLRDCPPFLSLHKQGLSNQTLEHWDVKFKEGIRFEEAGEFERAIDLYHQCSTMDDDYAELNFRLGNCYRKAGQPAKALDAYTRAQDLDALRFRADSRINEIIKSIAFSRSGKGVALADAKSFALEQNDDHITGRELLYEHVHLNLKGNFVLANCIGQQAENLLAFPHSMDVVDLQTCKTRLAYTFFDERRIDEINMSRLGAPPFTAQYSNEKEIRALREKISDTNETMDTMDIRIAYEEAINNSIGDWFLKLNYLRFLNSFKYDSQAWVEAKELYKFLPHEYLSSINLGITLKALAKYKAAELFFLQAIEINPYFSEAYRHMIALKEELNEYYLIDSYVDRSGLTNQVIATAYNRAGVHFVQENVPDSALKYFRKAVDLHPNFPEAQQNLRQVLKMKEQGLLVPSSSKYADEYNRANELFRQGKYGDAVFYYQKALKITPSFAEAHNNIGICFIQLNQLGEARQHFEASIKSDPEFSDAHLNLGTVLFEQAQYRQAIKVLENSLRIKPDAGVYQLLAESYLKLGDKSSSAKFNFYAEKMKNGQPVR